MLVISRDPAAPPRVEKPAGDEEKPAGDEEKPAAGDQA
jgi:hypothetical protein